MSLKRLFSFSSASATTSCSAKIKFLKRTLFAVSASAIAKNSNICLRRILLVSSSFASASANEYASFFSFKSFLAFSSARIKSCSFVA